MRVRLTRLRSNHGYLRTDWVEGDIARLPKIGECIVLTGEALEPSEDLRLIYTTPVVKVSGNVYDTKNSQYRIEKLD